MGQGFASYGYDYELIADDGSSSIVFHSTGSDKEKARREAQKASLKYGSAALLFFRDGEKDAVGAVTYVAGFMSSRDGLTFGQAMAAA